jgi:hypothetical protein
VIPTREAHGRKPKVDPNQLRHFLLKLLRAKPGKWGQPGDTWTTRKIALVLADEKIKKTVGDYVIPSVQYATPYLAELLRNWKLNKGRKRSWGYNSPRSSQDGDNHNAP